MNRFIMSMSICYSYSYSLLLLLLSFAVAVDSQITDSKLYPLHNRPVDSVEAVSVTDTSACTSCRGRAIAAVDLCLVIDTYSHFYLLFDSRLFYRTIHKRTAHC